MRHRPLWGRRDATDRSCCWARCREFAARRAFAPPRDRRPRQHRVIDFDFLSRIARLRQRLGEHHRDRIADMAGLAIGERRMRRHFHRRAVLGMDHPAADQIADLVVGELDAGEHGKPRPASPRPLSVDGFYRGMRVRRANEVGVSLTGPIDVVGSGPYP